MDNKTWREQSLEVINVAVAEYDGDGSDLVELEKYIRSRYPFGERGHYPYKAWLGAVNEYMKMRGKRGVSSENYHGLPLFEGVAQYAAVIE